MQLQSQVQVMGIDAGGTMTGTFFVRDDGRFVVGKAQSIPPTNRSRSSTPRRTRLRWKRDVDDVYPELLTCVYSGTAMLNRVVQRKGLDVGLMVNKGFEHVHSMGLRSRALVRAGGAHPPEHPPLRRTAGAAGARAA